MKLVTFLFLILVLQTGKIRTFTLINVPTEVYIPTEQDMLMIYRDSTELYYIAPTSVTHGHSPGNGLVTDQYIIDKLYALSPGQSFTLTVKSIPTRYKHTVKGNTCTHDYGQEAMYKIISIMTQ